LGLEGQYVAAGYAQSSLVREALLNPAAHSGPDRTTSQAQPFLAAVLQAKRPQSPGVSYGAAAERARGEPGAWRGAAAGSDAESVA
jgi:hypothetical protein